MDRLDGWMDGRTDYVYMCITDNNEDEKEGIYSATCTAMSACV